jgi:hypothetical protein
MSKNLTLWLLNAADELHRSRPWACSEKDEEVDVEAGRAKQII